MSAASTQLGSTLEALLDIELPVTLRFGRTHVTLSEVIDLGSGSVVDFGRGANEPVEILVNGRVVARGEAVMVQGAYGVRISEIVSRRERLETTSESL
ncbi:MAG TPA: flagellar motor switch protein FliN [Bryobacteraceae bacterium]|nr:flagellar motor switch protein FliN [Bryobacteraceae bacterium]